MSTDITMFASMEKDREQNEVKIENGVTCTTQLFLSSTYVVSCLRTKLAQKFSSCGCSTGSLSS